MKSITVSNLILSVAGNPFLSSLLILMVMITGLMTGSLALVIVSGVLAFGRPVFYSALYGTKADAGNSTAIESDKRTSFDKQSSNRAMAFDLR